MSAPYRICERMNFQGIVMAIVKYRYGFYARACPIYITLAPMVLVLVPMLPVGYDWKLGGVAAIVLLPLVYLCKQIGGDRGKKSEKALWEKWGGPPTTRFLRHGNREFNVNTRNRIHAKLRRLGLYVPSLEAEQKNPREADDFYESCIAELRRLTRNQKRFPRVFKELRDYGFRRNVFALKPYGLTLAVVSFFVCLKMVLDAWWAGEHPGSALVSCLINLGLVLIWIQWITEKAVRIAANRYAEFLLEACLDLEVADGNNSLSEC